MNYVWIPPDISPGMAGLSTVDGCKERGPFTDGTGHRVALSDPDFRDSKLDINVIDLRN